MPALQCCTGPSTTRTAVADQQQTQRRQLVHTSGRQKNTVDSTIVNSRRSATRSPIVGTAAATMAGVLLSLQIKTGQARSARHGRSTHAQHRKKPTPRMDSLKRSRRQTARDRATRTHFVDTTNAAVTLGKVSHRPSYAPVDRLHAKREARLRKRQRAQTTATQKRKKHKPAQRAGATRQVCSRTDKENLNKATLLVPCY